MVLKVNCRRVVRQQGDLATVSRHEVLGGDAVTLAKTGYDKRKKKVRVAEERNVYYPNPLDVTEKELSKQWYSRLELKAMKFIRFKLVEDILKADDQIKSRVNYQTVLTKAFQSCCGAIGEGEQVALTPEFFQCLARLLELCPSRYGMETVGVPGVAIHQQVQRAELRRSIKAIQEHGGILGPVRMEESIRVTAEAYSRGSRLYAGLIALAHAVSSEQ